jgi:hypothetical protein
VKHRKLLLTAWLILATLVLAHLALTHADVGPQVPQPFAIWLADAYGAQNAEDIGNLETLIVLGASFFIIALITAGIYLGWRRFLKGDRS